MKRIITLLVLLLFTFDINAKVRPPRLRGISSLKRVTSSSIANTFKHKPKKVYYTYEKKHKRLKPYTGRTSGSPYENPSKAMDKREKSGGGHHMNKKGYEKGKITSITTDYKTNRLREQRDIDRNGRAKSDKGNSGNAIRGVAKNKMPQK